MKNKKVRSQKLEARSQKQEKILPLASYIWPLFLLATVFYGCATSKSEIKTGDGKAKIAIEKISVVGDDNGVLIEVSGPITYTAFKLSDPSRLVLDMPDVNIEKVREPININNEFVTTITAASYGEQAIMPISRVEIGLKQGIVHEVKQGEGSIMIRLNSETALQQEAAAAIETSAEAEAHAVVADEDKASGLPPTAITETLQQEEVSKKEETVAVVAEEPQTATSAVGDKEGKKANKLLRIDAGKENGATVIKIVGNGIIGDFNAFDIEKPAPPRLVVDVWNVGSSIPKPFIAVNTEHIKKVRIGEYPNKIRLALDSNKKTLPSYTIERFEDSLVITVGKNGAKKQAAGKTVAAQTVSELHRAAIAQEFPIITQIVTDAKVETYAEVRGIDFKQLADKARLFVTLSKKVAYQLYKSADETSLVLDIKDTIIADEFRRTLDASDLNTSVAAISSFQSPIETTKDVRILVKLKEKAGYNISQENERIQIDFPLLAAAQVLPKKAEIKSQEPAPAGSKQVSGVRSQGSEETKEIKETKTVEEKKGQEQLSGYTGRKISLDFKDADISNILRLMAEVSNLNIIAGEDVKGKVSLRLVDVPWYQAFDIILKTNGLGKLQEGNVVRILPLAKIRQESDEALASKKAKEKLEDLEIKIEFINYATASALEPQIKGLLSDRGSVTVESRTNALIIKDIPANITKAVDLIRKLDTQTPQVRIEARIIEAQSSFARDIGVQWGAATATRSRESFNSVFGSTSASPPATTPSGFISPTTGQFSAQPTYAVSLPAAGAAGALGAMGFSFGTLTGDPWLLDLRISAGEKNGLTKTISRPRITTLDNKEAKISQGDSVPFETTSSSGTQTSFVDATLELNVTPHITPDGSISMKIKASRNSIGSFRSAAGTPSISKKEASTEIIVKDGETAVIGGIVVADKTDTDSGIPWFKDIPILGWIFKNKSISDSQTELLIFITPNIVKGKVEL
ncbi:MAG: type IV pilus secretin PilQ [Deltaproteobacteria bacterium]|nr:type IV pilus secretin PilQ [Deltaproteobacteria bacterium]